jgi:hypothetical protein
MKSRFYLAVVPLMLERRLEQDIVAVGSSRPLSTLLTSASRGGLRYSSFRLPRHTF